MFVYCYQTDRFCHKVLEVLGQSAASILAFAYFNNVHCSNIFAVAKPTYIKVLKKQTQNIYFNCVLIIA